MLYAGRLTREKGADLLAEAFLAARERDPRLHLVLAGGGPEETLLRERLGEHATFLGWLEGDELADAYASADVFLFASRTDTFGQVLLEAQASGLPVVAVGEGGPCEHRHGRHHRAAVPGRRGRAGRRGRRARGVAGAARAARSDALQAVVAAHVGARAAAPRRRLPPRAGAHRRGGRGQPCRVRRRSARRGPSTATRGTPGARRRSRAGSVRKRSRAGCASPPCQRMASARLRARPSCRKRVWPLTTATRPMPHSGGVRHSEPEARAVGAAVGEPGAHVVQQQVGVRADRLVAQRRRRPLSPVRSVGQVAASRSRAAAKKRSPASAPRVADVAPRGHGQRARVERHARRACASSISGSAAGLRAGARALAGRAGLVAEDRRRDPDVAVERAGVLLLDGRLVRLPAEAPERPLVRVRASATRLARARDPVAVRVVRVGAGDDRALRHGLEQARRRTPPGATRGRSARPSASGPNARSAIV